MKNDNSFVVYDGIPVATTVRSLDLLGLRNAQNINSEQLSNIIYLNYVDLLNQTGVCKNETINQKQIK